MVLERNNALIGIDCGASKVLIQSAKINPNKTIISKGVFTTCQKRKGCPPWIIASEKVIHDKKKKQI